MKNSDLLGHVVTARIKSLGPATALLAVDDAELPLPRREVPPGADEGDAVDVFVNLDPDQEPVATTKIPRLLRDEVAFLTVTGVTSFGAFFDWGLPKDLLVPNKELTHAVSVGVRYPVGLVLDETGRLTGTLRVRELLEEPSGFKKDAWVQGEAWRAEPDLGLFVIVERKYVGLLQAGEPHELSRGEAARFRIAQVQPDGKITLSLRGPVHAELENDAQRVLSVLERPDAPRVGDASSPDEIRETFSMSKKAFKRAVGRLLKRRMVSIDDEGFVRLERR